MKYGVCAGTKSKLLKRIKLDEYDIVDWTVRRHMEFPEEACGINPHMLLLSPGKFNPDSLGVELAKQGYYLFTNGDVFDVEANYIIAVHRDSVDVL